VRNHGVARRARPALADDGIQRIRDTLGGYDITDGASDVVALDGVVWGDMWGCYVMALDGVDVGTLCGGVT